MKLRYYQELSEGCLRIDAVTVRRLATRGELTAYRIAGEYRFTPAGVERFVESQRIKVGMAPGPDHPLAKFTKRAKKVMSLASEEASIPLSSFDWITTNCSFFSCTIFL